jgi:electron transfer flavoprotein alpha subunit
VANIVVFVELHEGRPLPVSLEVLGQARRLSSKLGATLYAAVLMRQAPDAESDALIAALARGGADKVLLLHDEASSPEGASLVWSTAGPAIAHIEDHLAPILFLFGATRGAREVAARAAAHNGSAFLDSASLELGEGGLTLWEGSGARARRLDADLEFPVVATVARGRYDPAACDDDAEVEVVKVAAGAEVEEIGWEAGGAPSQISCPSALMAVASPAAEALGATLDGSQPPDAPVLISLAAELRVALGAHAEGADADLAVVGDASALLAALAQAIGARA